MNDESRTIAGKVTLAIKVEASRFLAMASPVESKPQAEMLLSLIRQEYHDATHHCFAYRLGTTGNLFRYSDDGEPSGTAGKPILTAIDRLGLTDTLVVVTRYFGGIKLGVGGLARAYGQAADQVLKNARIVIQYAMQPFEIAFPHSQTGNVMRTISRPGVSTESTRYDDEVHLSLLVRQSVKPDLQRDLIEITAGDIRIEKTLSTNMEASDE